MKGKSVRERILDTATRLFYRQGTQNTGINQIIDEAEVAKASFYQYFPSKDTLIIECLDIYNRAISKAVKRIADRSGTLREFFEKWSLLIKRNARINPRFNGCPIANIGFQIEPDNQKIKDKFKEITKDWYNIFIPLFEKSRKAGEISPKADIDSLFREIIQINEGALIMWRLTDNILYLDNLLKAFLKLLK